MSKLQQIYKDFESLIFSQLLRILYFCYYLNMLRWGLLGSVVSDPGGYLMVGYLDIQAPV